MREYVKSAASVRVDHRGTSALSHLECSRCALVYDAAAVRGRCSCGGSLLVRYELARIDADTLAGRGHGLWRYEDLLPVKEPPVSLGEIQTPVLELPAISVNAKRTFLLKDDSRLPTSTFKSRGAAVAVSRARELGIEKIVLPTSGNAGTAWAVYAARAGIQMTVVMANDAPQSNQAEVLATGAVLQLVSGSMSNASTRAGELALESEALLASSFAEPYRLEGKKTCWLELFEQLGGGKGLQLPDTLIIPVGAGVAFVAAYKAAQEVRELGWTDSPIPRLIGVQAETCSPLAHAFSNSQTQADSWIGSCDTIASGMKVPDPPDSRLVLETARATDGAIVSVTDEEMREAMRRLASEEGILVCPEGAATLAAAMKLDDTLPTGETAVLYNTGSASKYSDVFIHSVLD